MVVGYLDNLDVNGLSGDVYAGYVAKNTATFSSG
jgi:hypothetical protein